MLAPRDGWPHRADASLPHIGGRFQLQVSWLYGPVALNGGAAMSDVIDLEALLRAEGYDTPAAAGRARALLEAERLTRPGKRGIAADKRPAVHELLSRRLARICARPDCASLGDDQGRERVVVSSGGCEICGGSNNRRAVLAMGERLRKHKATKLLIVGGTPSLHQELTALCRPQGVELRMIEATERVQTQRDAIGNMNWADVMVIWGSSPLPHKVSQLYTSDPPAGLRVIKVSRRGIEAVCQEIVRSFDGLADARRR